MANRQPLRKRKASWLDDAYSQKMSPILEDAYNATIMNGYMQGKKRNLGHELYRDE